MRSEDELWIMEAEEPRPVSTPSRVSGRVVVVAMFLFGITATAGLWTYWTLHTRPFRPLQEALATEFPRSNPRVDGGQRKMRKGMPKILRAVLRVDFDPTTETTKGEETLNRVERIARQHVDLAQYDYLDVYLYQGVPEQTIREKEFERKLNRALAESANRRDSVP
jgi:hypothetical protein